MRESGGSGDHGCADSGLLGTLTGSTQPSLPDAARATPERSADGRRGSWRTSSHCPGAPRAGFDRADARIDERPRGRSPSSRAGGSLERTVSLRSGAQRAGRAPSARPRGRRRSTSGPDLVAQLLECKPDAAFVALHGRDGEDGTVQGLLEAIGIPYTGSGPAACMRCTDKALAKYLMREAGIPTPAFHARSRRARSKSWAWRRRCAALEQSIGFPLVVKPASQGSALGVKFARSARSCRGRSWGRSPTTARS